MVLKTQVSKIWERFDDHVPKKRVVLLSIFSAEMPWHEEAASKFNKGLVGKRWDLEIGNFLRWG